MILLLVYAVVKFVLGKIKPVADLAEIVGLVAGVIAALIYTGILPK